MKVFLDMDGVFVDFMAGIHGELGIEYSYDSYPYQMGKWDIFEDIMLKKRMSFKEIDDVCTIDFWRGLPWMADGMAIYDMVMKSFSDVTILTTPMPNPQSWTGKVLWIDDNLGLGMRKKVVLTSTTKGTCAGPDTLLIDDRDKNVQEFREAGGRAILVPRPWNKMYFTSGNSYGYVKESIDILLEEKSRCV